MLSTLKCSKVKDLFFGSKNNEIHVFDLRVGQPVVLIKGHSDTITSMDLNFFHNEIIVSGSDDCRAIVWDIRKSYQGLWHMQSEFNHINTVSFSPFHSYKLAVGGQD